MSISKLAIALLVIVFVGLAGLSSCKKDYTCTCKTAAGTVYNSDVKTTKKKAEAFCADQQTGGRTCSLQ